MMHGYGSNEGDLFSLARFLPPEFVVASLRGPNASGPGFTWFHIEPDPVTGMISRDINEVNSSTASLLAWLDELETEVGELPRISVLGFSQGGVMTLQLLRHAPERFMAGIVLAGFAVDDDTQAGAATRTYQADERVGQSKTQPSAECELRPGPARRALVLRLSVLEIGIGLAGTFQIGLPSKERDADFASPRRLCPRAHRVRSGAQNQCGCLWGLIDGQPVRAEHGRSGCYQVGVSAGLPADCLLA